MQDGLPKGNEGSFLLGVSENKLLMDGIPLETGQAERSFAQLLTTAGLASIHFSNQITKEEFTQLVRAFALGGAKAQDVVREIKNTFGDSKSASIRINEVRFVAADPSTGEVSIAAQIAAQTLGPEFKQWLNDPQKLLQLIAAAEGAKSGGVPGGAPVGSVPNPGPAVEGGAPATGGTGGGTWAGGTVPLQEEEVIQTIRLLTRFGEVGGDPSADTEALQKELTTVDANTKVNLQQLLGSLAAQSSIEQTDNTPLLMKAAEHMAIRFALERFQKGEVKVNAVHQMMEHMSRQMDTLRQILKLQEDKMSKAGILVESHADILDRMFWAEVPEAGKKSVLLSHEAPCVPPRNVRQFVEILLDRGDKETAVAILLNYLNCLDVKEAEPRRKIATGISQLADLFAASGGELMALSIRKIGELMGSEPDPDLQSMLSAAFVRLSTEASTNKQFGALSELCIAMENIARQRPVLVTELRPRIGVENRLPEFIEEALHLPQLPADLLQVLRRTSQAAVEHLSERFFRCMRREECDRMIDIVKELGAPAPEQLREMVRTGQPRQAASVIGLLSRLDVPTLLELLPTRLPECNRFYHDVVVRQMAYGAAHDRGRSLLELLEILDPLVIPQAIDEIGMSGDRTAVPPLVVMAEAGEAEGRSALLQLKAMESLGRLRENEAIPVLREPAGSQKDVEMEPSPGTPHCGSPGAGEDRSTLWKPGHGGKRAGAGRAGDRSARFSAGLSMGTAAPIRAHRVARTLQATISSSWGKSSILIRELSLGGGMGTKEDNLRVGSEANIDIAAGVRRIRGQVLLRRARVNEVGFEIVNTDLESRYRLRRILMDSLEGSAGTKEGEWDGQRKPQLS